MSPWFTTSGTRGDSSPGGVFTVASDGSARRLLRLRRRRRLVGADAPRVGDDRARDACACPGAPSRCAIASRSRAAQRRVAAAAQIDVAHDRRRGSAPARSARCGSASRRRAASARSSSPAPSGSTPDPSALPALPERTAGPCAPRRPACRRASGSAMAPCRISRSAVCMCTMRARSRSSSAGCGSSSPARARGRLSFSLSVLGAIDASLRVAPSPPGTASGGPDAGPTGSRALTAWARTGASDATQTGSNAISNGASAFDRITDRRHTGSRDRRRGGPLTRRFDWRRVAQRRNCNRIPPSRHVARRCQVARFHDRNAPLRYHPVEMVPRARSPPHRRHSGRPPTPRHSRPDPTPRRDSPPRGIARPRPDDPGCGRRRDLRRRSSPSWRVRRKPRRPRDTPARRCRAQPFPTPPRSAGARPRIGNRTAHRPTSRSQSASYCPRNPQRVPNLPRWASAAELPSPDASYPVSSNRWPSMRHQPEARNDARRRSGDSRPASPPCGRC